MHKARRSKSVLTPNPWVCTDKITTPIWLSSGLQYSQPQPTALAPLTGQHRDSSGAFEQQHHPKSSQAQFTQKFLTAPFFLVNLRYPTDQHYPHTLLIQLSTPKRIQFLLLWVPSKQILRKSFKYAHFWMTKSLQPKRNARISRLRYSKPSLLRLPRRLLMLR